MLPRYIEAVGALPLNGNGKVDRKQLPVPSQVQARLLPSEGVLVPPATPQQAAVRDAMARVLGTAAESICCERSDFFALGGDSLSALRLLMQIRPLVDVGVEQLFRAPTVHGICAPPLRRAAARDGTADADTPRAQLRLLCLQQGAPARHSALVLIHPAGASALCYMPLVGCLPSEQPVYAIDDEALTGGAPFGLASIEEAAEQSRELLCEALGGAGGGGGGAGEGGVRSIVLAGWSYGGVVAVQLAAALEADPAAGLRARSVVMFDAPLGQSEARGFHRDGGVEGAAGSDDGTMATKLRRLLSPAGTAESSTLTAADDADDDALARLAAQHFAACNALLDRYAAGRVRVCCPLVDVRPRNSECAFLDSLDHLTTAAVVERVVAGDHWTMLFGEHTEGAAAELSVVLKTA